MLRAKTRGNLSNEELAILNNAISNLQMVFVEVSQGRPAARMLPNGNEAPKRPAAVEAASSRAPAPAGHAAGAEEEIEEEIHEELRVVRA